MTSRFSFATKSQATEVWSVVSFQGTEEVSHPFELTVRVKAASTGLERRVVGEPASLTIRGSHDPRVVSGIVAAAEVTPVHADGIVYQLTLVPRLWSLRLGTTSRIFQDQSIPDIVKAVLDGHQLDQRWSLARSYPERLYTVQYQESDLAFVERLLADEGIFYFVETDDGGKDVVVFGDDSSVYSPIDEPTTVRYDDTGGLHHLDEAVQALGWHQRLAPQRVELTGFDYRRPTTRLAERASQRDHANEDQALYHHDLDWNAFTVSQPSTTVRLEQARRERSTGDGRSRVTRLRPGTWFELDGHPNDDLNGRMVVVKLTHHGSALEHGGGTELHDTYVNHFTCLESDVAARPERPERRHRQIMETATVVGPSGEEIHTDEHGRVKVQFHWDREGKGDDHSSCWIRTMMPWAGAAWGMQFVPRVGTEVVVSFAGGDTDRPVVLGSLYNGANVPPFALPGRKTQSGLRTRSTPGGEGSNELRFDDAAGAEEVYLHAQRDLVEVVENDRVRRVKGHEDVRVTKSRKLEVLDDHVLHVAGNQVTTIDKNHVLHVVGSQIINVDGSGAGGGEGWSGDPGSQGSAGSAPAAPQGAATGEAAIEGMMGALNTLKAETRWLAEILPEGLYEEGFAAMQIASSCLDAATSLYLEAHALANAPPSDVVQQAATGVLRAAELREAIASEMDVALRPQPSDMHRMQTAVIAQLAQADRIAGAASRAYDAASRGEAPEPVSEVTGKLSGGGGAEDYFTKPTPGSASEMNIVGGGVIHSHQGFSIHCGPSFIKLTPAGVEISGPVTRVYGGVLKLEGAHVHVTGSGIVDIKGNPIHLNC